jgi:hypothetical protein
MKDIRAAAKLAILRKNASEMQLPDLLKQSTGEVVDLENAEDPRMQQAKARLDEAKIAQQEAKADNSDVAVATEQQKAELAKEQLMIEEQRAENERKKLELEGHKLDKEREDLMQEDQQRQQEAMMAQQQAEMQQAMPDNAMQQASIDMRKVAGAAPFYFGLPNLYSLKMFESPLRPVTTNPGDS